MLSQGITALVSPLGVALLLGGLALGLALQAQRRRATLVYVYGRPAPRLGAAWWLGLLALAWLWVWSTPLASDALRGHLENQAGPRALQDVGTARVLVVLGGSTSGPSPPQRPDPALTGAADRLWHAARLYHAGKAPQLLLVGGPVATGGGTEAAAMQQFLADMGVPLAAMALEKQSHNTASNARLAAQLLRGQGIDTVMLVTSALHMPRAQRHFEREGLKVHPAPTDFEVVDMPLGWRRVLPDTGALHGSARAFKELVGGLALTLAD
jgi:uncharacterized SAM-binding protein YcdF (DUF218 family)